jgi:hypothetical protein|tara:strand:+ start:128 stop:352 length:225 start_codon:yes stop_codon:yes gene_type:complete
MRYRNPKFKSSIRDEIKPNENIDLQKKPQAESEGEIKVPPQSEIKRLWWSKYSPDGLKNPQVKSEEKISPKKSK